MIHGRLRYCRRLAVVVVAAFRSVCVSVFSTLLSKMAAPVNRELEFCRLCQGLSSPTRPQLLRMIQRRNSNQIAEVSEI